MISSWRGSPLQQAVRWDFLHLGYYDDDCSLAPLEGRLQRIGSDGFLGMPAMPMMFSLLNISPMHIKVGHVSLIP